LAFLRLLLFRPQMLLPGSAQSASLASIASRVPFSLLAGKSSFQAQAEKKSVYLLTFYCGVCQHLKILYLFRGKEMPSFSRFPRDK
jgi:hypothetical protein